MTTRPEYYLAMFNAIESMIRVLDHAQEFTDDFTQEVEEMRTRIERVVDMTVEVAARHDWQYAYRTGGINPLFEDFNRLAARMVNS